MCETYWTVFWMLPSLSYCHSLRIVGHHKQGPGAPGVWPPGCGLTFSERISAKLGVHCASAVVGDSAACSASRGPPHLATRSQSSRKSKGEPDDHPTVGSWYEQDLRINYEWHNSYGMLTEVDAERLVPPASKLTEQDTRTIPYFVKETQYLIQQGLINCCEGQHNPFLLVGDVVK